MDLLAKLDWTSLESQISRFFGKPVILDTGPLIFLLIGLHDPNKRNSKDIWGGRTKEELDLLLRIIKSFKSVVIIPQVLAECTNLLNKNHELSKYQFILKQIREPLKELGEIYIEKNIILNYSEFSRFGTTDIGIIECSKQINSLIVTEDSELNRFCHENSIPCLNFTELRPSLWNR